MSRSRTLRLILAALFTAIIVVLTLIPIPFSFLGVPMTLQTFVIAFCGFLMGWKLGLASVSLYLFLGIVGLPVFAGFQGGFQRLIGPTGGFLYGFLILVVLCGITPRFRTRAIRWIFAILLGSAGLLLCYLCGAVQLATVSKITFQAAFIGAALPFLPKDLLSIVVAFSIAYPLRHRIPFLYRRAKHSKH